MKKMKIRQGLFTVFIFIGLSIGLSMGLGGCAMGKPHLPVQSETGENEDPRVLIDLYKLAVGDQIQISVWKNPELSLSEPVRPDGRISVPLVGDVMAVGLTPELLAWTIEQQLSSYVKSPNVTVILTSVRGHEFLSRIRVTGSVERNISLSYHQGMTVLDAVLEAGSLNLYADGNNTKLHRRTEVGSESYDIRLDDMMKDGDMTTNVILMPGDIITVPERSF
jgi:polysaccharide export outer membrane protein